MCLGLYNGPHGIKPGDHSVFSSSKPGDKVAQLVRCRTSNQLVAGSIPGRDTLVCPWARQFIPYCFSLPSCKMGTYYLALIRQCLELVRYMLPVALEYPLGD